MTKDVAIQLMMIEREANVIKAVMKDDIPYDIITATAMMNVGTSMLRGLKISPSKVEDLFLRLASIANNTTKETEKKND